MQIRAFLLPALLALAACGSGSTGPPVQPSAASSLDAGQKRAIGRQIWQNESGGTVSGLTSWNAGEQFASLGIGHFIWYPAGQDGPFVESWPAFIDFAQRRGADPPAVAQLRDCPWDTQAAFRADFEGPRLTSLRRWLSSTVPLQTDFIIARSRSALSDILAAAPASDRQRIRSNYEAVATTSNGTYALIDYVNFKGEGTNPDERYQGEGWGLLQVLAEMNNTAPGPAAAREFAAAAKRVLDRRIANAPPARGENRWRAGWHNRVDTYGRPL